MGDICKLLVALVVGLFAWSLYDKEGGSRMARKAAKQANRYGDWLDKRSEH